MNEERKAGGRFHFGSPLNIALSFFLTLVISLAVVPLKGRDQFGHLYEILHNRGPTIYMMFFVVFMIAIPLTIETNSKKNATMSSLLMLSVASLAPFLFGLLGTIQALGAANVDLAEALEQLPPLEHLTSTLREHAMTQGHAMETAFLGLVQSIGLLFPSMSLLTKKELSNHH